MNKKGFFSWGIVIIAIIVLTAAFVALSVKYNDLARQGSVGTKALSLFNTYLETEKALLYIDSAAGFAAYKSVYELAENGGFYKKSCSSYLGYALWTNDCKPEYQQEFGNYMNDNLNELLIPYYLNLPLDNYKIDIKQGNMLEITGFAVRNIEVKITDIDEEKAAENRANAGFGSTPAGTGMFNWPLAESYSHRIITSCYGIRTCAECRDKTHDAIDINGARGDAVYAAADGEIIATGGSFSKVVIEHTDGYSTSYLHLSKIYAKTGDIVIKGQIIGLVGGTGPNGPNEYPPHLHFEIDKNSHSFDPLVNEFDIVKQDLRFLRSGNCVYNSGNYPYKKLIEARIV